MEPQSPAPSSVFLQPSNGKQPGISGDGVYEVCVPNSISPGNESQTDIAPGRISLGEISLPPSIPPSVPSEYQFPWPPNTNMAPIFEESIRGGRGERYEYKYDASGCDVFWCLLSLGAYLFDIGSDILVAFLHFRNRDYLWFGLTLAFVVVPAVTMTIFSFVLYIKDWKIVGDKASPFRWASRVLFMILQLGPLLR